MDESSRRDAEQAQESTRWLLLVLGITAVLAAAVIVVADIPDLVGRRWQEVGVVAAGVTVLALVVGLLAVVRALDPVIDTGAAADVAPPVTDVDDAGAEDTDAPDTIEPLAGEPAGVAARKSRRRVIQRYRTTRLFVTGAVVIALLGMGGMAVASVQDGNKVEERARNVAEREAEAPDIAPITEPRAVVVQLTTPGLAKVAAAMQCTGAQVGAAPLQGWAIAGDFKSPTVVLFTPTPACRNARVKILPADGFVYPTLRPPTTTPTSTTAPAAGAPVTPPTTAAPGATLGPGAP